jgi:DNA-binding MarR family transcriptional regulator
MSEEGNTPEAAASAAVKGVTEEQVRALVLRGTSGAGHVIRRLFQQRTRLWQGTVPGDLTGPQFTVLGILYLHGSMDQGTLGRYSGLDKSTAAPVLERLRRRGLIAITRDPADARRKLLELTADGRETVISTAPHAADVEEQLLAVLPSAEREEFFRLAALILGPETAD